MTGLGLIYTVLLLAVTLVILLIAFWGKGSQKFTRLQDVYRDKYLDETETLDDDLKRGKIDEETYETSQTELARDLLAVAHPDRQMTGINKAIVMLIGVFFVAYAAAIFWDEGYTADAKNLDMQRAEAKPYVDKWLAGTTVEALQRGNSIEDLNPPAELQQNLLGTLAALNLMSSRDHHTDPKELNLLGKIYLNMDQLKLAEKAYLDLYRLDPNNDNTYYTLLNVQLAMNDYKLNDRLEGLFDQFIMSNAENENLLLYYSTLLFENQKIEKALHYFSILANRYPEGSENRQLLTDMIEGLANQNAQGGQSTAPGQTLAPVPASDAAIRVSLDVAGKEIADLPQEAILFLFVRNSEMGPPLAAKRIPLAAINAFPLALEITDQDLLMPGSLSISTEKNLSISAKISLNGDPISSKGDIEAEKRAVTNLDDEMVILLDRVVE